MRVPPPLEGWCGKKSVGRNPRGSGPPQWCAEGLKGPGPGRHPPASGDHSSFSCLPHHLVVKNVTCCHGVTHFISGLGPRIRSQRP